MWPTAVKIGCLPYQDIPCGFLFRGGFAQTCQLFSSPRAAVKEGQEVSRLLSTVIPKEGHPKKDKE